MARDNRTRWYILRQWIQPRFKPKGVEHGHASYLSTVVRTANVTEMSAGQRCTVANSKARKLWQQSLRMTRKSFPVPSPFPINRVRLQRMRLIQAPNVESQTSRSDSGPIRFRFVPENPIRDGLTWTSHMLGNKRCKNMLSCEERPTAIRSLS